MKLIVAITGASGSIYAKDLIERLIVAEQQITSLAIISSQNAKWIWEHELSEAWPTHKKITYYENNNFMAPFASGSSKWDAMAIVPASMGSIGRIANGISDDLISRSADVMLKEERKLIICPRETPLNQIHLRNLLQLQKAGGTILPTNPSFYSKPKTIKELIGSVSSRIIDHLGIRQEEAYRWS